MAKNNSQKQNNRKPSTHQDSIYSSDLWKELQSFLRQPENGPQYSDNRDSGSLTKHDLIYEEFILKHTSSYSTEKFTFESSEQFNNTAFFDEQEPDNIIKAVRAAFWANKAAHLVKDRICNLNTDRKPTKASNELIQKMQVFYSLKAFLIKEAVDKLRTPEMSRLFPSWGFSKDEHGKDTFIIDVPGHGQVSMHIKPHEIGQSIVESCPYKYKFSGLTNPSFPSADRFDGAKDDSLAVLHHLCVADNDFEKLDKIYNRYIYDYHFSVPKSNHPSAKNGNFTIPITTLFSVKDDHLVPLHKMDSQPKVLYAPINCKEAQALLFFQIVPDGELKGEVKKPFHFVSYKGCGKNTQVLIRAGTPEARADKRDKFASDTVIVYCDLDSNGKFVTNTEMYQKGAHSTPSSIGNKSVVKPSQCDIISESQKTYMGGSRLAYSR